MGETGQRLDNQARIAAGVCAVLAKVGVYKYFIGDAFDIDEHPITIENYQLKRPHTLPSSLLHS